MIITSTDQLGRTLELPKAPQRIISLVPSQTELLFDLDLGDRVVGITKFCVHPPHWRKEKTIIGGTKNFHFDIIDKLQPDLVIGNKEENYAEGIEFLSARYPVWMSDVVSLEDALSMIKSVSELAEAKKKGLEIIDNIHKAFNAFQPATWTDCIYLMWRDPWMAAASGTFINAMMEKAGFDNSLKKLSRYPVVSADMLKELQPSMVLLSSEPYPFSQQHIAEINAVLPNSSVRLVDGEMFSWYGSRLALFPPYINLIKLGS